MGGLEPPTHLLCRSLYPLSYTVIFDAGRFSRVSYAEGQERPGPERGCNREQRFAIKEAAKIITFKVLFGTLLISMETYPALYALERFLAINGKLLPF